MCRQPLASAAALISVVMTLAACSSGGSPNADPNSFAARLDLIPASVVDPETDAAGGGFPIMISMADMDHAADLADIERPTDPGDLDAVLEYLQLMSGYPFRDTQPPPMATLFPAPAEITRLANDGLEEFIDEVGWSVLDVSWFVEQSTPPQVFTVMGGDFHEDDLTAAMGSPDGDLWRLGGEDHEVHRDEPTPARPLGLALTLALDDGNLTVSRLTPAVEEALDGDTETLADDPTLRALAEAFDDEDAYSAMLLAGQSYSVDAGFDERISLADGPMLLEPFIGFGSGLALDDGEPFIVLAYAHADDAAAEANADALRRILEQSESLRTGRPWSEQLTVDTIRTNGSTLVARLGVGPDSHPQLAYDIVMTRDSLVVHG